MVVLTSGGGKRKPPPPAHLPAITQVYTNAGIGVAGGIPRDWTAVRGKGLLQLASKDHKAIVIIAGQSAAPGSNPPLLREGLASIRTTYGRYGRVTVKHSLGQRLGGLPARSVVAYARNSHHVLMRVLVAAANGRNIDYLLEAFTARSASVHDLTEAQEVVLDLRLAG